MSATGLGNHALPWHETLSAARLSSAFVHLCFREISAMNRRQFLGAGAAGLALSHAAAFADSKPPRVALIGCG